MQKDKSEQILVGYCRVSTEFQVETDSITQQIADVTSFCHLNGLPYPKVFIDEGISAKVPINERKGGKLFLEQLEQKNVVGIIFTKLDRPFRSTGEALTYIDEWTKKGLSLYIINFMGGRSLDTRDPVTKAMLGMVSVFAQFERELIAQRITDSLNRRKQTGKVYCRSVYGYKNVDGKLVEDIVEQQVITLMQVMKDEGKTLRQIAEYLNIQHYPLPRNAKTWHHSTVDKILKNSLHQ